MKRKKINQKFCKQNYNDISSEDSNKYNSDQQGKPMKYISSNLVKQKDKILYPIDFPDKMNNDKF